MRAPLARLAAAQHGAFDSAQALTCYSPAELRSRLDGGRWQRVFRTTLRLRTSEAGPRLRCAAAALEIGRPVVACLHTAAELHGFGVLDDPVTHVVVGPDLPCRHRDGLWPHQLDLPARDVVRLRCGLLCTGPDRTAVDLARDRVPLDVLPVLDAALDAGCCTPASLDAELAGHAGRRGVTNARRWVPHAARGTDSPQESRLRYRCLEAGLPPPALQLVVGSRSLDLGWKDVQVGLEYDGEVHDGPKQRRADRRRHNGLQHRGWTMYYATDEDVYGRTDLFDQIHSAILGRSRH